MAKFNGTAIILDADGSAVAHVENATLTINRELPEANDKDSAPWADHLDEAGLMDWEISFDGNADWSQTTGNVETLFDLLVARTAVTTIFGIDPAEVTGLSVGLAFSGSASYNSVELGAPVEETAPISGTAVGKGILNKIANS
jgi:hypothetical protein